MNRRGTLQAMGRAGMLAASACLVSPALAQGWEPVKPVTLVIPAGTGGGADQMARFVQGSSRSTA